MLLPALSRHVLDSAGNEEMPQRLPAARLSSSKMGAEISSVSPECRPLVNPLESLSRPSECPSILVPVASFSAGIYVCLFVNGYDAPKDGVFVSHNLGSSPLVSTSLNRLRFL